MQDIWVEFGKVALAHLLAVASPGPDFALVLRQSLAHGRRTALWTSLGVGSAIFLHVGYSLLGLGWLIRSSELWFAVVKYAGAVYIAWLGVQSIRAKPRGEAKNPDRRCEAETDVRPTPPEAFFTGFLTNALNPKATLFFLSLFALIVSPETPRWVQAGYGLWMAVTTALWFSAVSVVFTRDDVRMRFLRQGHWIDRVLGVVFLGLAVRLALTALG